MLNFLKVEPFDFEKIFGNFSQKWYYYFALGIVFLAIILCLIFKKNERNNLSKTQLVVYIALCSAFCFLANYFTIKVSDLIQISFVAFTGFVSGFLLGAPLGFVASFVGDFICGIVHPFGAYNPIIGIGNGLFGLIPGVIFSMKIGENNIKLNYLKVAISSLLTFICCSFFVNTLGLSLMYSMTFYSLLIKLPYNFIATVVNCILCLLSIKIFPRILPKDKFNLKYGEKNEDRIKSR